MVWIPLATTSEFQVKLVDEDDAIRLPSTRKVTFLTFFLILTDVVTRFATVESGVGEEIFIGLADARLWPSSTRTIPTSATNVSLSRPRPIRVVAISPPRPHHKPIGNKMVTGKNFNPSATQPTLSFDQSRTAFPSARRASRPAFHNKSAPSDSNVPARTPIPAKS